MKFAETALGKGFMQQGVKLLMRNPETSIPRLLSWAEKIAKEDHHKRAINFFRETFSNEDSPWYGYARRVLSETHPNVREKIIMNFFINSALLGIPKEKEMSRKLGFNVPWAILMDPTENCNLNCTGCWAGEYDRGRELDFETMDRICSEAEELGIYFIVLSGGEPLMRKDDVVRLAEKHPSQLFHIFTNGTLIDEKFVENMKRVGNIFPLLSIEGFEEKTDERRGRGVFRKLMNAMDLMRENGCVYGISVTYTRKNTEEVASEEFIDLMVEKGVYMAWYFTYVPIGKDIDLELMATPQQRKYMFDSINYLRRTKPMFIADFWNDGEKSEGCIAGGRKYFHINAAGDVEPCAFVHYATCNIKDMSLKEALQNQLFNSFQKRQPFNDNMLRPCPLIDNPEMIREIVHESNARPTQHRQQEDVDEFSSKLQNYAREWGRIADDIWYEKKQIG